MNQTNNKSNKKILTMAILLIVLIATMSILYVSLKPKTQKGAKTVVVQVVLSDDESKDFTLHTDEEFLRGALEEIDLIRGTESEYGLMLTQVNGITADDSKQEWWCITKAGEMLMTGVDSTPIQDGDNYELTLTVGY